MPNLTASLVALIQNIVPESRKDEKLRSELLAHCQDVLASHIGQTRETDIAHLADQVRRHLSQSSSDSNTSLRFTNLLSRLLDQSILSRKHGAVLFLHSLSSSSRSVSNAFLPSFVPPPIIKPNSVDSLQAERVTSVQKDTGKTKAEILRDYRQKSGRLHLPESALLRDTLFILQGISGKYVQFSAPVVSDAERKIIFLDDPKYIVSASNKALIHRLAELGHLYSRISSFVLEREGTFGVGMTEQSLCHYLQMQLTEYYKLIAILESQMSYSSNLDPRSNLANGHVATMPDPREEETGLTLKRLEVWITDWRLKLRMMSVCVEGCRGSHGGALVNLIHSYTENGDPFVRRCTDQILEEVSKPFFATLHKWLFSGELHDPFLEFFVALDPELANVPYLNPSSGPEAFSADGGFGGTGIGDGGDAVIEREVGLRLWESKYQFRKEMLPTFVGEVFGKKIFSTGKSLNFIRYNCHDSDWVATREKLSHSGGTLQYSDIRGLEHSIDKAYSIASQRLFDIFFEKFKLLDHLKALKNYLLLGHGDFAEQLMESLGPSLSKPANTLYRHNLTATLEAAIRTTNAQNDSPDIHRRLDARMLEYSHGEIGWDVFTLEYKVDAPLDTVVDSDAILSYLRLFSHLWKLKRIERALNTCWMRIASGARTFLRIADLEADWHSVRVALAEMIHFIRQMRAFCHLEVIECSWKALLEFTAKKEGDLDALVGAHRSYLDRLVKKTLLLNAKVGKEENLLNLVKDTFKIILQFCEATDNFYNYSLAEASRRDSWKDVNRGVHTTPMSNAQSTEALSRILTSVKDYSLAFSEHAQTVVHSLQSHSDLDCRFLAIRLSFSEFYKSKKDLQHKSS